MPWSTCPFLLRSAFPARERGQDVPQQQFDDALSRVSPKLLFDWALFKSGGRCASISARIVDFWAFRHLTTLQILAIYARRLESTP